MSSKLPKNLQLQRADGPIDRKVLEDVENKLVKRKMAKMVEKRITKPHWIKNKLGTLILPSYSSIFKKPKK